MIELKIKNSVAILKINNPNDSIFFLMKTFYWIIKGFEDGQKKSGIEWEHIQKNLNYK